MVLVLVRVLCYSGRSMRALPLVLSALAGCWLPTYTIASGSSDWYDIPPVAKPADEVLRQAREVLARQGYRLRPSSPGDLGLESEWDVHLSAHWREGFRTKVEVQVERLDGGRSLVRIRSFREFNDNARVPMNAEAAQWVGASMDDKQKPKIPEPALRVRQILKVKLEGPS